MFNKWWKDNKKQGKYQFCICGKHKETPIANSFSLYHDNTLGRGDSLQDICQCETKCVIPTITKVIDNSGKKGVLFEHEERYFCIDSDKFKNYLSEWIPRYVRFYMFQGKIEYLAVDDWGPAIVNPLNTDIYVLMAPYYMDEYEEIDEIRELRGSNRINEALK